MLRYPGGKLRLMPRINDLIKEIYGGYSFMEPWTCADVFVGGGGSLIKMAEDFSLWNFHVNDLNPVISSLWEFFRINDDTEFKQLYYKIRHQKATIDAFRQMLEFKPATLLENAFKVIFLNKTSYGGIIEDCAPLGGWKQNAEWHIDEYWKPETIIRKIAHARKILKGRILSVSTEDFESFLNKTQADFYYCDPPYLANGTRWYSCDFTFDSLCRLKKCVFPKDQWCISIDRFAQSEDLFSDCNALGVNVTHTSRSAYKTKKEDPSIIITNELVVFPKNTVQ